MDRGILLLVVLDLNELIQLHLFIRHLLLDSFLIGVVLGAGRHLLPSLQLQNGQGERVTLAWLVDRPS